MGVRLMAAVAGALLLPQIALGGADGYFLSGKHVYLSPGHGWFYYDGRWVLQRPNTHDVVEDFSNAEAVSLYLKTFLENSGATVWMCREPDQNPHLIIVDDADRADYPENGTFEAAGSWVAGPGGFANFRWPYQDGDAVFPPAEQGGSSLLSSGKGSARWTPAILTSGTYSVSVSYSSAPERTSRALYRVHHAGGTTDVVVDQRVHGSTWVPLGEFRFNAGSEWRQASVELVASQGQSVSADAVRFGGGYGMHLRGEETSGKARFEEAGRYHAFFQGAPADVYDAISTCYDAQSSCGAGDDASARPRYAAWQHADGEDAVFVSWHSNAGGGRGTSTFYHQSHEADSPSALLAASIQRSMVADMRQLFDPEWRDRNGGPHYAGEINPRNNSEMPSALVEVAFHDQADDAMYILSPGFREAAGRAVYGGIARWFAERDGQDVKLLPSAPEGLSVQNDNLGRVVLRWHAGRSGGAYGDPAERFIVYRSTDGYSWDNGSPVREPSYVDRDVKEGQLFFYRTAAENAGGRSRPTKALGCVVTSPGRLPAVLLVDEAAGADWTMLPERTGGPNRPRRQSPGGVGTQAASVAHALALHRLGTAFDSCDRDAVALEGGVPANYHVLNWVVSQQPGGTLLPFVPGTLLSSNADRLRGFLATGGTSLMSGGGVLGNSRLGERDRALLRDVFGIAGGTPVQALVLGEAGRGVEMDLTETRLSVGTLYMPETYSAPGGELDLLVHIGEDQAGIRDAFAESGRSAALVVVDPRRMTGDGRSERLLFRRILQEAQEASGLSIGRIVLSSPGAEIGQILRYPEYEGLVQGVLLTGGSAGTSNDAVLARFARMAGAGEKTMVITQASGGAGAADSEDPLVDALVAAAGGETRGGFHAAFSEAENGAAVDAMKDALRMLPLPEVLPAGQFRLSDGSRNNPFTAPDALVAMGDAGEWLKYSDGSVAEVRLLRPHRSIYNGFPLEQLETEQAVQLKLEAAMEFLAPPGGSTSIRVTDFPASAGPGERVTMTAHVEGFLNQPLHLDIWMEMRAAEGGPVFRRILVEDVAVPANSRHRIHLATTLPKHAPEGEYEVTFYTGDYRRNVTSRLETSLVLGR